MTVSGVFVQGSGRASRVSGRWPPVNQTPKSLWGGPSKVPRWGDIPASAREKISTSPGFRFAPL